MRSPTAVLTLAFLLAAPVERAESQDPLNDQQVAEAWTAQELENLLAPIALYPDPILAQVLIAATFPDQIAEAAAYVRTNGTRGIDEQTWELSVKAVAHYAPVLNLMAEGEDWTIALGQAYVDQPRDVMNAVQSLRRMANAQGNLESTPQQTVFVEQRAIKIIPAQPKVIYVPTYDPAVVYFRPIYVAQAHPAYWSWGAGYPIGVWLTYDFDWYSHRVYYHGWHGPRWVVASRPWIVISPFYVAPRHTVIYVNRGIGHRHIDYDRLRRHTVVHRGATFDRRQQWDRGREPVRADRGTDRRDDDRYDRRRATPAPTRATPARGNIVPTRTWASRSGTTLSTRSTPTRAEPSRPTPGGTPRGEPRGEPRRDNTPGRTDRTAPRTPSRGSTPLRSSAAPERIVKTPAWGSGRTPGSASTPRPSATPTRTRTTTSTPRATPSTPTRPSPSASPSTDRKRIVPAGRAASTRNTAPAPRASNRTPRSSSTPRASAGTPRSSSTPRASSGSRSSGSSAPARSSGRSGGERKRP